MSGDLTGLCLYIQEQGGGNNFNLLVSKFCDGERPEGGGVLK